MTITELQNMVQSFQAQAVIYQSLLDKRLAASTNPGILQAVATKVQGDQGDAQSKSAWAAENSSHPGDWTQPEHAYWVRLAGTAILAGVVDV